MARQALVNQGPFIVESSRSHLDSVGLLWTVDQLVAETPTWQHTTLRREEHRCPGDIQNCNHSKL